VALHFKHDTLLRILNTLFHYVDLPLLGLYVDC